MYRTLHARGAITIHVQSNEPQIREGEMPNAREAAFLLALGRVVHVVATISILVMLTAWFHPQGFGTKLEAEAILLGLCALVLGALIRGVVWLFVKSQLLVRLVDRKGTTRRSGKIYARLALVESDHIKQAGLVLEKDPRFRPDAIAVGLGTYLALFGYGFWALTFVLPLLALEVYSIRRQLEKFL